MLLLGYTACKHRRLGSDLDCPVILAISLNLTVSLATEASGTGQLCPFLAPLWVSYKLSTSVLVLSTCLVSLPDLNRTLVLSAPREIEALRRHSPVLSPSFLGGWVCTQGPMTVCWGPSDAICSLPDSAYDSAYASASSSWVHPKAPWRGRHMTGAAHKCGLGILTFLGLTETSASVGPIIFMCISCLQGKPSMLITTMRTMHVVLGV